MKIDFSIVDTTQFMMHQHIINGEACILIQPQHIGAKWDQKNKIFRSSLWNSNGELISASFFKFTNWGENPENFPVPTSLKNTKIVEKLDGSTLIVSKYKGNYILRTRGTSDATVLNNGAELEIFKQTHLPKMKIKNGEDPETWSHSFIFEWTSPLQKIVLNYGDVPAWTMIGIIRHVDYSLFNQAELDMWADTYGFDRPSTYTFPSVEDLMTNVEAWKGKEGVCVYSKDDQAIHKIKSFEYLKKHRFKSEATLENTLELYFAMDKPVYQDFETKLKEAFDYECFEMVRGYVSNICDANKEVQHIVEGMQKFVDETLKPMQTRREQAGKVLSSYGDTNRSAFVFALLDGKSLNDEQLKKLFWQVMKK